jgi:carboxyl-terminal processing protease
VVAGEDSYGKGVVENIIPLSDATGLALTIAQYFTPSGRSIQRRLPGTALADAAPGISNKTHFYTDNGRPVTAGGGIHPDVIVPPRAVDPWCGFLNQHGLFTDFASQYITYHPDLTRSFEPDSDLMTEFRNFLTSRRVRTPLEFWVQDQDYLKLRIKTEVFNLVFGLTAGNEVEVKGDPQVLKALQVFPRIPAILKAPLPAGAKHVKQVLGRSYLQEINLHAENIKRQTKARNASSHPRTMVGF